VTGPPAASARVPGQPGFSKVIPYRTEVAPDSMPKIVDHEERRREVIQAAWRVIVRDGLEEATSRAIAREAGLSNGVLMHYFADMDDILLSALRYSHSRIAARLARKLAGMTGLQALRELLLDNLPLDNPRTSETRLEVSFWSRSLVRHKLAALQRHEAGWLLDRVTGLIAEARDSGEADPVDEPERVAARLLAYIDGLSLHRLLYPDRLSRADLSRFLEQELDMLVRPRRQRGPGEE